MKGDRKKTILMGVINQSYQMPFLFESFDQSSITSYRQLHVHVRINISPYYVYVIYMYAPSRLLKKNFKEPSLTPC